MAEATDKYGIFVQNLEDASCDKEMIQRCILLAKNKEVTELLRLLTGHRKSLLGNMHKRQKEIDCLDFLIFQLKHNSNEGGILE